MRNSARGICRLKASERRTGGAVFRKRPECCGVLSLSESAEKAVRKAMVRLLASAVCDEPAVFCLMRLIERGAERFKAVGVKRKRLASGRNQLNRPQRHQKNGDFEQVAEAVFVVGKAGFKRKARAFVRAGNFNNRPIVQ